MCTRVWKRTFAHTCICMYLNVYVNINVEIVASVLEMVDNIDLDPNEFRFDKDF